ncbi:hypothetical protein SAMD00019534_120690 [Acytostelium subglobosum LB1]|uniref:hypothetical protein n=1 Tax=Acytostelium subglobosum LB1 TaxID=1410327 RepID=UPI000644B180|nr:hypothetical protein SAMD00019534_120690 [Acytostelium subglobosum LB1]GAM28893.1 hypothetical protein SAMD00019534_120690 [Acytostelium subglobosum LB1]|eukprot:XP_012748078.1 hypothetical protein SAMD00019534_120690 [Acytostelium subglobosum LB1]
MFVQCRLLPGYIPSSVRSLTFGQGFNENIYPNILPQGLTYLHLGTSFQKPLCVGSIPSSVHTLHFESYDYPFDQDGVLPSSLTKLTFQAFSNRLPPASTLPCLQTLSIPGWNDEKRMFALDLPPTLTSLIIYSLPEYCTTLPINLTHLSINYDFAQCIVKPLSNLTTISLGTISTLRLGDIPESVTYLSLFFVKHIVAGAIPPRVITLSIERVDQIYIGMIPASVRALSFGNSHSCRLPPGSIPLGVHTLDIPKWYKHPIIEGLLPESLTILNLWDQRIRAGALPSSLKVIKLLSHESHLPAGFQVETIELTGKYCDCPSKIHPYLAVASQVKFRFNNSLMCLRRLDGDRAPYFLYSDQVIHFYRGLW